MKNLPVAFLLLLVSLFHLASPFSLADDAEDRVLNAKWEQHLNEHPRLFSSKNDHDVRKSLFAATDKHIEQHNAARKSYKIGHNQFSSMTLEEKKAYLGKRPKQPTNRTLIAFDETGADFPVDRALPTTWDFRSTSCGSKQAIKNQAACGSCWSFAAIAAIEYAQCVKTGKYVTLSEQMLVDCENSANGGYDLGCGGGDPQNAYYWLLKKKAGQVVTSSAYPYTSLGGMTGTCRSTTGMTVGATLKSYAVLPSAGTSKGSATVTNAIQNAIYTNGVIPVCFMVYTGDNQFYGYKSGVYNDPACSTYRYNNHCVNLVGWGTSNGIDYWLMRNEWGTGWGMGGYMMIKRGVNLCGIESEAYTVVVA